MSPGVARPDYEDVVREVEAARSQGGERVRVAWLGESVEGRPIPCAICTDPATPAADKQHVLIVAGQHGCEESGRAIALELLRFLVSDEGEAAAILRKQVVAIVPCGNPDGAMHDTMRNAEQIDIAHTYAFDSPAGSVEGRLLEAFALEFVPDVFVDVYGRAGGGMKEVAWLSPAWGFSSDRYFLTMMSAEMARAGEQAGFPQCELSPAGELAVRSGNVLLLGEKLAAELKTLCMGLETIEYYYREAEWRATGLARLRRLLRFGMEDSFGLGEAGYPCSLVSGNRIYGLKGHGATAQARRHSRVELVRFLRNNYALVERGEDGLDRAARVRVVSHSCEGANPSKFAMLLRIRKPCQVQAIEWRDGPLERGDEHGWRQWEDDCSVIVQASIAEPFGGPERELVVHYDSPLFAR